LGHTSHAQAAKLHILLLAFFLLHNTYRLKNTTWPVLKLDANDGEIKAYLEETVLQAEA
jgi:hypothetical protein